MKCSDEIVGSDQRDADEPPGQIAAGQEVIGGRSLPAARVEGYADHDAQEAEEGNEIDPIQRHLPSPRRNDPTALARGRQALALSRERIGEKDQMRQVEEEVHQDAGFDTPRTVIGCAVPDARDVASMT